jgi:hypothetical protein
MFEDQVSHPYKTRSKIKNVCFDFYVLDSRREDIWS